MASCFVIIQNVIERIGMLKDTDTKNNKSSILKTALLGGLKGGLRLAATSAVGIAIDMIIERFERRDTKKIEEK